MSHKSRNSRLNKLGLAHKRALEHLIPDADDTVKLLPPDGTVCPDCGHQHRGYDLSDYLPSVRAEIRRLLEREYRLVSMQPLRLVSDPFYLPTGDIAAHVEEYDTVTGKWASSLRVVTDDPRP